MHLLLDTHIWIWMTLEPARLSRRVARILENTENQLWLSPVSVWELLMLTQKARVRLNDDAVTWACRTIERLALREATLTFDVALETSTLGLVHSDPSDRLIVASAKVFGLTLVTSDEKLIAVPGINILANR
jgi:PIN domain nuclease of toxin-antitoxin system